jgi:hypothetical protein
MDIPFMFFFFFFFFFFFGREDSIYELRSELGHTN